MLQCKVQSQGIGVSDVGEAYLPWLAERVCFSKGGGE